APAEMCGNGIRVFAHYLLRSGLVEDQPEIRLPIGTRSGVHEVTRNQSGYQVDLGRWHLTGSEPLARASGLSVARPGLGIDLGNPHVVVALASDAELDGLDLNPMPLLDPAPAGGA